MGKYEIRMKSATENAPRVDAKKPDAIVGSGSIGGV